MTRCDVHPVQPDVQPSWQYARRDLTVNESPRIARIAQDDARRSLIADGTGAIQQRQEFAGRRRGHVAPLSEAAPAAKSAQNRIMVAITVSSAAPGARMQHSASGRSGAARTIT